ncbi:MAG: hypothetical protein KDJ20_03355 [Hyphomicrobiales bacterium]|nr:hypothetical protein [Hyphomicrobiales bacterium]MCC2108336.1 hypothetical protein [Hyphomicrobiales bacterium]
MEFDYSVPAEFFAGRALAYKRAILAYQRFDHAAEAIRFAMEELSPTLLRGSFMEVEEARYSGADIERLYESDRFPLTRGARARETNRKV